MTGSVIVGFSGTRSGCTPPQLTSLTEVLIDLVMDWAWELHHGDCVGADEQAHAVWRACRQVVVLHPPTSNAGRAMCDWDQRRDRLPHLQRNNAIVEECQVLVAAPATMTPEEAPRSGTWYTVRRAMSLGREVILVLPDGSVRQRTAPQGSFDTLWR